jgi:hypothetical protein
LDAAHTQQPGRRNLPVMVNGKRVKTIDVHAHCHFHEAGALLGEGTLDRFPGLKVIAAHGGGYLPSALYRPLGPCLYGRPEGLQSRGEA